MKRRYVNIREVSEYTSLPVKTLYDWASQRKFPSIKCGRRLLFDLEDIDKHLLSMKRDTSQPETIVNKIIEEYHGKDYNS